jgi:hypothetical protein
MLAHCGRGRHCSDTTESSFSRLVSFVPLRHPSMQGMSPRDLARHTTTHPSIHPHRHQATTSRPGNAVLHSLPSVRASTQLPCNRGARTRSAHTTPGPPAAQSRGTLSTYVCTRVASSSPPPRRQVNARVAQSVRPDRVAGTSLASPAALCNMLQTRTPKSPPTLKLRATHRGPEAHTHTRLPHNTTHTRTTTQPPRSMHAPAARQGSNCAHARVSL